MNNSLTLLCVHFIGLCDTGFSVFIVNLPYVKQGNRDSAKIAVVES